MRYVFEDDNVFTLKEWVAMRLDREPFDFEANMARAKCCKIVTKANDTQELEVGRASNYRPTA